MGRVDFVYLCYNGVVDGEYGQVVNVPMVVTTADATQQAPGGLRAMDPARDLGAIANLIAAAFADEMDQRGRAALREMRWLGRLSPLVWWWAQADPTFRDAFNGFVWEEPGPKGKGRRVVGNVSLSRAAGSRRHWIVCNVVVHEDYRGRGIGQQLVDAAIAEARLMGAVGVVLQVYKDNLPALRLYTRRGFQEAAGETDFALSAIRAAAFLDAPGYRIRAWQPAYGQAALVLARQVIPEELQWLRPIEAGKYRPDWWSRLGESLGNLLAGRRAYRLAVFRDDDLVAVMVVTATFRHGEHRLDLLVHPDHAGRVEAALVSRALHMLAVLPARPVRSTVGKDHTALIAVLRDHGFVQGRTLLTLRKNF
jgi:ribosomal protein S18 acetylase RimI-like enzyme